MEIELVVTPRPGPEQPADPGAPEAALQSDSMAADGVATMESHSRGPGRGSEVQPLQDTWVFPSTAVFDGVSVPLSELAPRVLAGESDAQLARTYALLGESLAPSTLGDGPGGQPESAGQSESVLLDSSEYMPGPQEGTLTPQRVRQISSAASDLHKPLRTISMTGHLALQDPPDLASVIVPSTPERLVWGEPWPADALRFYRYTVPFSNRPLYFEQPNLERCGLHCGIITPYTSAAHFFGSAVLLPLHMVLDPPCICVPTLGDCPSCSSYGLCPHCNLMR